MPAATLLFLLLVGLAASPAILIADGGPEGALRGLVKANAERTPGSDMGVPEARPLLISEPSSNQAAADLSGEWEINEEDKSYKATLDRSGNGTYSWQNGRITTTAFSDRKWQGTWKQTGNDREGGFDILLSEDGTEAKGVWWYSRVGDKQNIPPRQWGGSYLWKRLTPVPGPAR